MRVQRIHILVLAAVDVQSYLLEAADHRCLCSLTRGLTSLSAAAGATLHQLQHKQHKQHMCVAVVATCTDS
jgi:hypothetical protein